MKIIVKEVVDNLTGLDFQTGYYPFENFQMAEVPPEKEITFLEEGYELFLGWDRVQKSKEEINYIITFFGFEKDEEIRVETPQNAIRLLKEKGTSREGWTEETCMEKGKKDARY